MSAFAKRRKVIAGAAEYKLSWCMGPVGAVLQHQPLGPDEKPVDPLRADGTRIPGFCPGQFESVGSVNIPKGTIKYCQCKCHGEDRPEAYPGYFARRAEYLGTEQDTETAGEGEVTESAPAAQDPSSVETPVALTGVVPPAPVPATVAPEEPPLPEVGNPLAPTPETDTDAPASAQAPAWVDDGLERTETKTHDYPNGSVTRTERQSVTRQGKEVTLVEWIAKLKDGTKVGSPQWSRKAAKELLP